MADTASAPPGLSFPRATFAKLTPAPFLQAHLKQTQPIRPSGRRPDEAREAVINTGSLSHSNGSAVVRLGDTSVVCGVSGEILLASEVPHPPNGETLKEDLVEHLGLLVPNVELSTGCSPACLPGNPPSNSAQSLSWRIGSLLHASSLVNPKDLTISYTEPKSADMGPDEEPNTVVKAYWALYIDISLHFAGWQLLRCRLDGCHGCSQEHHFAEGLVGRGQGGHCVLAVRQRSSEAHSHWLTKHHNFRCVLDRFAIEAAIGSGKLGVGGPGQF